MRERDLELLDDVCGNSLHGQGLKLHGKQSEEVSAACDAHPVLVLLTFSNGLGKATRSTIFLPFTSTMKLPLSGFVPSFGCTSMVMWTSGFEALINFCSRFES